jgi:hypothetical protein
MPTPPRRAGKSTGRSGGAPDMMARATAQASRDASALFAHLEDHQGASPVDDAPAEGERAALTLERLASRMRAGAWTAELAELVARAQQVEAELDDMESE